MFHLIGCTAKLGMAISVALLCVFAYKSSRQDQPTNTFIALSVLSGCSVAVFVGLWRYAHRLKIKEAVKRAMMDQEIGDEADAVFLKTLSGLPTRFSYKELERATENFSNKLGRGGFGSVYEGRLEEGSKVAVKRLERGEGSGQKEFCAEVATISRIRHMNLVSLRGFCSEGGKRLLVYELMSRGSLDRWLFRRREMDESRCALDWATRFQIALGTARGLAYLHEECEEAILHLDVKPENILLDDEFRVKVSDFGLSRSMERDQGNVVTTMRGTPGYLAPEWLLGSGIDSKIDVYSYGVVLLELVSGRRSIDQSQADPEYSYLPSVAYRKVVVEDRVCEILDPLLRVNSDLGEHATNGARQLILIALWCIQERAASRPNMGSVIQMLESPLPVPQPPMSRTFLYAQGQENVPNSFSISMPTEATLTAPR